MDVKAETPEKPCDLWSRCFFFACLAESMQGCEFRVSRYHWGAHEFPGQRIWGVPCGRTEYAKFAQVGETHGLAKTQCQGHKLCGQGVLESAIATRNLETLDLTFAIDEWSLSSSTSHSPVHGLFRIWLQDLVLLQRIWNKKPKRSAATILRWDTGRNPEPKKRFGAPRLTRKWLERKESSKCNCRFNCL